METRVLIDHREWRNWVDRSPDGAIGKLNELLKPHGVEVIVAQDGGDWIELRAKAQPNEQP